MPDNSYALGLAGAPGKAGTKSFSALVIVVQVVVLVFFYLYAESNFTTQSASDIQLYNYLIGVALMMLVGFGYLMTFLQYYGLGAVGLTMLVTCLGVQVSVLVEALVTSGFVTFNVDLMALLNGNFAVAAFLISFGGLIGKVNPSQLVILVVFESIFYCVNKVTLLTNTFDIKDTGGTIIIHMFGAYFGLTIAAVLGQARDTGKEKSSMISDVFSLIGTTFLWLYWPSFVAGAIPAGTVEAQTALTNTVLALLASTVVTFAVSPLLSDNILRPVDIQNATLAGGVSIGAIANIAISPFGALLVGSLAGLLSTIGFCRIQDVLLNMGLHDSCGIHNLHGMPSLLGGLASVVVPMLLKDAEHVGVPSSQLACIGTTLAMALVTGAFTGLVMKAFGDDAAMADDEEYWEVAKSD